MNILIEGIKMVLEFIYYLAFGMWDYNDPIDMMFWFPMCVITSGLLVMEWIRLWKFIAEITSHKPRR